MQKRKLFSYTSVAIATSIILFASACSLPFNLFNKSEQDIEAAPLVISDLSTFTAAQDIHTVEQQAYLNGDFYVLPNGVGGTAEKSKPKGVTVNWKLSYPKKLSHSVKKLRLDLAEDSDFDGAVKTYLLSPNTISFTFTNLYVQTEYGWQITAIDNEGREHAQEGSTFTTAGGVRNMDVDGVTNVRDVGGYERADGTLVKQGMIYRTARLNDSWVETVNPNVTEKGKKTMLDEMGVKTEIDLRGQNPFEGNTGAGEQGGLTTQSVLGSSVNYQYVGLNYDYNIRTSKEDIVKFFKVLGQKENYPVFFHCHIGTDRTGMFSFLINALMGVSETDLYHDYMFSNFGYIESGRNTGAIDDFLNVVCCYSGVTIAERTENILISYGVAKSDIDTMREMLTCDKTPIVTTNKVATAERYSLGVGDIDMNQIPGVKAWTRYGKDSATQMAGSESILPLSGDSVQSSTNNWSDNLAFRNNNSSIEQNIKINGTVGGKQVGNAGKASSLGWEAKNAEKANVTIIADENTDKIILFISTHAGRGTFTLYDEQGNNLARTSVRTNDTTCKNAARIEFSLNLKTSTRLRLEVWAETAYAVYMGGIAVTGNASAQAIA